MTVHVAEPVGAEPKRSREQHRKAVALLIVIALAVGALASWTWTRQLRAAEIEERDDLDLFLDASSAGWAQVTDQYFQEPEAAAQLIGELQTHLTTREERIALLAESIRGSDALDAAFLGFVDGSFLFVGRSDEAGPNGFRTRAVSFDSGVRRVELTWADADLVPVREAVDDEDTFDPRERPWFEPIEAGAANHWTEPYIFASSQRPGITHSAAVRGDDGDLVAVVGIDIRLTQLAEFLDQLRPGRNGEALVVDKHGQLISASMLDAGGAGRRAEDPVAPLEDSAELVELIASLGTSDSDWASGRSADGARTTVTRAVGAGDQWYLAIRAFDQDFISDTSSSASRAAAVAAGVLSAALVALLGLGVLRYWGLLRTEADSDELTGLLSRRAVKRLLGGLLEDRDETPLVAIIDLDEFKTVNDQHGHLIGDKVLSAMAGRIELFAAENNAAAGRLGGDEFVVVATEPLDWRELSDRLGCPLDLSGQRFDVGASIGIAAASPEQPRVVEELFSAADRALFDVKRAGGGDYRVAGS